MQSTIKTVEFDQIRQLVSNYTYSLKAKNELLNLVPETEFFSVLEMVNKTDELLKVIAQYGSIPFLENFDNNLLLNLKQVERIYSIEELLYLKLFLKMSIDIKQYLESVSKEFKFKHLSEIIELNSFNKLYEIFNETFNDYGEIYDDATKELKEIRQKIRNLELNLTKRLNDLIKKQAEYLNDSKIVIRNGRSCLAVKDTYKNKIKGVIHDISASKQTIFIEPEVSLQINADIELNKLLEQKEIQKILTHLTKLVNEDFDSLLINYNKLIKLDIIHAKAKYSLNTDGIKPNLNNKGFINLINAKHPLIPKDEVVPISLNLDENESTLLITGPNTGGKTVTLKTVGLLTLMIQSGILVPLKEDSSLAIFDNIFVDIGDEQSIENSLSTFSSHITKIISFINNLTNNSLVLLDELGSGTDPNEGVALAIAIIEELQKKDIRLIVTSHFSELKTYAYEKANIKLASVAFDIKTLKPLYHLEHGIIGQSHARLIAERLGMKKDVINHANNLFMQRETELAKIIDKLSLEKQALNEEQKRIKKLEEKYLNELTNLNKTKEKLINEQNQTLEKIKEEEIKKWEEKVKEVNEIIKIIEEEKNVKPHHVADLKGSINIGINNEVIKDEEELKKGDQVFIIPYQQYGYIINIENNKYIVKFGNFELEFKNKDLTKVEAKNEVKPKIKPKKQQVPNHDYDKSAKLEVDLRGLRFEEVKEVLDKSIDKALLSNIRSLTIIHGFGTGALKKAVDQYIKKSSLIKSHRGGREGEGLGGVTIITLK